MLLVPMPCLFLKMSPPPPPTAPQGFGDHLWWGLWLVSRSGSNHPSPTLLAAALATLLPWRLPPREVWGATAAAARCQAFPWPGDTQSCMLTPCAMGKMAGSSQAWGLVMDNCPPPSVLGRIAQLHQLGLAHGPGV